MANTFVDYTGDNTTTSFAFSIPYLDDSHIVVQVDQASVPGGTFVTKTLTTDYTIQTSPSNAIIFNSAPATGDRIRIKRVSDSSTALVDFENGSVLTEVELDRAYLHNLYLNEEIAEGSGNNTMVKDSVTGNFNGDLARIANVADPVDPQDVTTKNFTEATYVNTAGDTMTGVLSMGTNKITNVVDPTTNTDAATKNYVDDTIATSFATGTPPPGNTIGTVNLEDNAVTYAKLQNVAANNVLLGNDNGAGSDAQELSATEVRTILNVADGATNNRASHTGTQTASTISDFDTEVSNNSAVTANTAKVTNATHTGDVTGSTSLTIANNAVTSAKISSTDTTFKVSTSDVVVNDAGGNIDFRVEGDTNANLILTDASADKVSIRGAIGSVGETTIHGGLEMKDGNIQISRSNTGAGIRMEETVACSSPNQQSDIIMSIPDGSIVFTKPQKSSNQTTHKFEPDGDTLSITGSYGTISDRTLKENIIYLTDEQKQAQVDDIKKVKFAKYNLKGDSITQLGVIAQDLKETSPGLVKGEEGSLSVKQSILHQKAVVALQVALDKIEALEARLTLLES